MTFGQSSARPHGGRRLRKILPRRYLELPRFGCLNVHASLLPERGAAPIQWAVLRGHAKSGVSIMQMDEGMDTGDVLRIETLAIGPNETSEHCMIDSHHCSGVGSGARKPLRRITEPGPQDHSGHEAPVSQG